MVLHTKLNTVLHTKLKTVLHTEVPSELLTVLQTIYFSLLCSPNYTLYGTLNAHYTVLNIVWHTPQSTSMHTAPYCIPHWILYVYYTVYSSLKLVLCTALYSDCAVNCIEHCTAYSYTDGQCAKRGLFCASVIVKLLGKPYRKLPGKSVFTMQKGAINF